MNSSNKPLAAIGALFILLLLTGSFYTVSETEQVIITRFGKLVGQPVNAVVGQDEAGLHFKLPFIDTVNRIEKRILEWDGPACDMPTRDKLYISVDNFARWRIGDPTRYFQSLRDERSALSRLDDIIGSETRSIVAKHDLIEVVRSNKDRKPVRDEKLAAGNSNYGTLPPIQYGRSQLDLEILAAAGPKVKLWGIELLDIRFKRINYKAGVIDKIYARMTSEREQIADRFKSEGAGEAAIIMGSKELELLSIESEAYRKEQEIMGKADATATEIYSKAYNSSPLAAEFYQFTKTLDTYRKAFDRDTTTVFTTDSDLFRLMKHSDSAPATPPAATPGTLRRVVLPTPAAVTPVAPPATPVVPPATPVVPPATPVVPAPPAPTAEAPAAPVAPK